MRSRRKTLMAAVLAFFCLNVSTLCLNANALSFEADAYIYDEWGKSVPAPVAYVQKSVISGSGAELFSEPKALYIKNNIIYVSDTGNDRIVVLDSNYEFLYEIKEVKGAADGNNALKSPEGIFIDEEENMYICDTGNHRIVKTDSDMMCLMILTKPESDLLGDDVEFSPTKVIVNRAGNILVVADGIYMGLVNYDSTGRFQGFFGGNRVEVTAAVIAKKFWNRFSTEQQKQSMTRSLPVEYANMVLHNDLIYAVVKSSTTSVDELKKLNSLGNNVLRYDNVGQHTAKNDFGDLEKIYTNGSMNDNRFSAVDVNERECIALLDSNKGHVFIYDEECNLIFIFGNVGSDKGALLSPVDIVHHGEDYLILDSAAGSIKLYTPTPYAEKVVQALDMYRDNKYSEASVLFSDILKLYSNSRFAYTGLGKASLQKGDYKEACQYFKLAGERRQYSVAFREYRKEFIAKNLWWLLAGAVLIILLMRIIIVRFKRWMGYESRKHKVIYH